MFFSSLFNQKNFFSHPKKFQKLQIITHSEESKEFYKKKFQMFSQFLTFSAEGKNLMNITMGCCGGGKNGQASVFSKKDQQNLNVR